MKLYILLKEMRVKLILMTVIHIHAWIMELVWTDSVNTLVSVRRDLKVIFYNTLTLWIEVLQKTICGKKYKNKNKKGKIYQKN